MPKFIRSMTRFLFALIVPLVVQSAKADFVMNISIVGPASPVNAGAIANFDFNVAFSSNDQNENVNSISFKFGGSPSETTSALIADLNRFSASDQFWIGGFDTNTGDGNFTAAITNEIFNSNSPKTVGRISINTTGLAPGNYNLFVQSTDWLVTGSAADGGNVLFDGTNTAGTFNSITFPPIISFTITAVPEPSSLLLVSMLLSGGCFVRHRWSIHQAP